MPFGNKDLMLSVLPKLGIDAAQLAKLCAFHTFICRWPTFCGVSCPRFTSYCNQCSIVISFRDPTGCFANSCGAGGSACDPTQFCFGSDPFVIQDLEDLVTIKADLLKTIKQLEVMEKEGGLVSGITTAAQADEIEANLKQQLEHVRAQREGLSR